MKTLKKTLCLVLAMVMVFGLCAISASAKLEYSDNDAIDYAEAVDVLTGIGILAGDASGFRPKADITRAEAAKILAYIKIGNAKQADALKASTDPFPDVPASHWAAGYIAYCNADGIIVGMGDGYHPNDKVTGLQFATMLLRALGYGKDNEFVGSDWAINASKMALSLDIFEGNIGGANNDPATREECALYAFNMITKPQKVNYSTLLGGYITDTALGSTGGAVAANTNAKFADDFGLESKGSDPDAFGRPTGQHWEQDGKVITADYADSDILKASFTTAVTGDDIYKALGSKSPKAGDTVKLYDNSKNSKDISVKATYNDDEPDANEMDAYNFKKGEDDDLNGTGNGIQTYVYKTDDEISIVIIDTYMVKIEEVIDATAKKDRSVKVDVLENTALDQAEYTYETDDFDEGDYVLITVADDEIQSMVAVPTKEAEITRFTQNGDKKSVVADGTTYYAAENVVTDGDKFTAADKLAKGDVNGKDRVLYIDKYGYLIAVETVAEASNYVYAAHFGDKTDVSGDFDGKGVAVKLYYADGTNAVVTLNTDDSVFANGKSFESDSGASSLDGAEGIYKLTMKSNKAILKSENAITGARGQVNKNKPSEVYNLSSHKINNKTVFFYVTWNASAETSAYYGWKDDDFKVTAYTGIGNVPKNTDNKATVDVALAKSSDESSDVAAVLVKDELKGDTTDTVYFFTGDYDVVKADWTVKYEVYVNGDKTTLDIPYGTEEKKNAGVEKFVGDPDDESDTGVINMFFTLDSSNEPTETKLGSSSSPEKIDDAKYINNAEIKGLDDYEITIDATHYAAAKGTYKIVYVAGSDIKTLKALNDAIDDGSVDAAVQLDGDDNVMYVYVIGTHSDP